MKRKRIYLDNCCYNRPYDDQAQIRISLESQAKLAIQELVKSGKIELATSFWSEYENNANPIGLRKNNIRDFQREYAYVYVKESMDKTVKEMATEIERTGVKHKDACHVACAIIAECDYFISTDDRLLKYVSDKVKVVNPIEFINGWEEESNDEYK